MGLTEEGCRPIALPYLFASSVVPKPNASPPPHPSLGHPHCRTCPPLLLSPHRRPHPPLFRAWHQGGGWRHQGGAGWRHAQTRAEQSRQSDRLPGGSTRVEVEQLDVEANPTAHHEQASSLAFFPIPIKIHCRRHRHARGHLRSRRRHTRRLSSRSRVTKVRHHRHWERPPVRARIITGSTPTARHLLSLCLDMLAGTCSSLLRS
jgi:hypothetical protein